MPLFRKTLFLPHIFGPYQDVELQRAYELLAAGNSWKGLNVKNVGSLTNERSCLCVIPSNNPPSQYQIASMSVYGLGKPGDADKIELTFEYFKEGYFTIRPFATGAGLPVKQLILLFGDFPGQWAQWTNFETRHGGYNKISMLANAYKHPVTDAWTRMELNRVAWSIEMDAITDDAIKLYRAAAQAANPITNWAEIFRFEGDGDFKLDIAGKGIILTNAAGTVTKRVRLNDAGDGLIFETP